MDNQQPSLEKVAKRRACKKAKGTPGYYDEEVKTCVKCGETKLHDDFVKCKQNSMGRTTECKDCRAKAQVERYQNIPPEKRKRSPEVHAGVARRHKEAVFDHYGRECRCCGEDNPLFLTVDHIEPIGTKNRYEQGQNKIYSFLRRKGFPEGFQILCFNCNCGRARNGGVCPHHEEGSQAISQESSGKRREVPGALISQGYDMVEPGSKDPADFALTFHDNGSWPFTLDRVQ